MQSMKSHLKVHNLQDFTSKVHNLYQSFALKVHNLYPSCYIAC